MTDLPQTSDCFACGKDHPNGLGLAVSKHGDTVRCLWEPRRDQTGFYNAVHGGLTATVLDEAVAWACGILGRKSTLVTHIALSKVMNWTECGFTILAQVSAEWDMSP